MDQPTPTVTRADVERVIRRDFPSDQYDSAMSILAEYGGESWHRELHRVQLAVLKLAAGRLDALRREIETAKCDYRDVLAYAEYPAYMKTSGIPELPEEEQRKIIDADWRQYETWLERPAEPGAREPPSRRAGGGRGSSARSRRSRRKTPGRPG